MIDKVKESTQVSVVHYDIDELVQLVQSNLDANRKMLIFRIGDDAARANYLELEGLAKNKYCQDRLLPWAKKRGYIHLMTRDKSITWLNDVITSLKTADVVGVLDYSDEAILSPKNDKRPALDALLKRHNIKLTATCDSALSRKIYKHESFWNLLYNNKYAVISNPEYIESYKAYTVSHEKNVLGNLVQTVIKTADVSLDDIYKEVLSIPCQLILYCIGIYKYELYKHDFGNKVLFDIGQMFIKVK